MLQNKQQKTKSPWLAYAGYLFQLFLKRPFGYIVAILYVVYLAVILLIVPSVLHLEPLFIWNVGGFNMPIFNLFFIAAMAASVAVAIFRTGRDDGTELSLSAKPLTKGTMVGVKTAVYLIIMLIISLLTVAIVSLTMPIFGKYDEFTNATGILPSKYIALIWSMIMGNTVNMLFFGAIAVFISMVGGQVIIMIGTIGLVFLMCLMNFIFPQILSSATEVLSDKYHTEILSYSCNTLGQYNNPDLDPSQFNYAAIQCITDDDGEEDYHYDTYEYWTKACNESGRQSVNYIDLGKQLSSIYSSFGLDDSKLKEASKLVIGTNAAYNYYIDELTHITTSDNLEAENYPISYYGMIESQGKKYPAAIIIGGDMSLSLNNWYARSTIFQIDFNSVVYISDHATGLTTTDAMRDAYGKNWFKINELYLNDDQKAVSQNLFYKTRDEFISQYDSDPEETHIDDMAYPIIINDDSGAFFEPGTYDQLPHSKKALIMAKNLLYWSTLAHDDQINSIIEYWKEKHNKYVSFPFSSNEIELWHNDLVGTQGPYKAIHHFNLDIFNRGIQIEELNPEIDDDKIYAKLNIAQMGYAETFNNLYQYHVTSFYNIATVIAVWSIISGVLFAGSIVVYKRTDFK